MAADRRGLTGNALVDIALILIFFFLVALGIQHILKVGLG